MTDNKLHALVVDDEEIVRSLLVRALTREGFACDEAADGLLAQQMVDANAYDVVVTDLRMPNRHGHALAADLVARPDRPVVVVVTGFAEPRLARDLIARGVDAIDFKPVAHDLFAAKVIALVERRRGTGGAAASRASATAAQRAGSRVDVDRADIERKLGHLSKILPVSRAAFDVFSMTSAEECKPDQIAAAVARDASLSVDVLRMANSSFYNPSGRTIVELNEAVMRIGLKRVGELALATSTLSALTGNVLPWMNADLTWRRSIAAGAAIDLLLARIEDADAAEGLFLSAIMHSLGRIVLGMLYPGQYQDMIQASADSGRSLDDLEQQKFPLGPDQVMGCLLKIWGIPEAVYEPLKWVSADYFALSRLAEPVRTKAELLKLGIVVGAMAIGQWEPWDRIEFPPAPVLRRFDAALPSGSPAWLIEQTRKDTGEIIRFRHPTGLKPPFDESPPGRSTDRMLTYCNLSPEPFDFLGEIVRAMGIELVPRDGESIAGGERVLLNCLWSQPHRLAAHLSSSVKRDEILILADAAQAESYARFGRVLSLPASYGALRSACEALAEDRTDAASVLPATPLAEATPQSLSLDVVC